MGQPVRTTKWQKVSGASQDLVRIVCNGDIRFSSIRRADTLWNLLLLMN